MKPPIWHADSRGFWLSVCIVIATIAGWVMDKLGMLK